MLSVPWSHKPAELKGHSAIFFSFPVQFGVPIASGDLSVSLLWDIARPQPSSLQMMSAGVLEILDVKQKGLQSSLTLTTAFP